MLKLSHRSSRFYLFVSITAALLAALSLLAYLQGLRSRIAESGRLVQLVVAARDLGAGDVLDASAGFYGGHARPDCRSDMNVTFRLPDESLEKEFVKAATARGLMDLKGHRSVGGIRASIYNAMPVAGVTALRDFMLDFQQARRA